MIKKESWEITIWQASLGRTAEMARRKSFLEEKNAWDSLHHATKEHAALRWCLTSLAAKVYLRKSRAVQTHSIF